MGLQTHFVQMSATQEKHQKLTFINFYPKAGNIWLFRKVNSANLVYKPNNTELSNYPFPFCQYHLSYIILFYLTTNKLELHLPYTFSMAYIEASFDSLALNVKTNQSSKQENESESQKVRSNLKVSWKSCYFQEFFAVQKPKKNKYFY